MFKNRNDGNIVYKCTVRLLEDVDVVECEFQPHHKGSFLVEYICDQLQLTEKDYFGLRYVDGVKQRQWLDLAKSIIKQIKDTEPFIFSFRVKFYPADPFRLSKNGKIMIYQQLKRDLRHGRIYCSLGEAANLGALIVQEELGDYDPDIHNGDYIATFKLAIKQSDELEQKIMDLHKKREIGQERIIAIDEFISLARGLESYGADLHPVKDHRGNQLYLGINYSGINTFSIGKRVQHFRWSEIHKLNYEGKMFIAHLSYTDKESREPKKHTVGFKCPTGASCRFVWRCAIEQMLFFTLATSQSASVMTGGGFMRSTKFKYSGRTEREILTDNLNALKQQHLANNTSPSKRKANSVPATPSSPQGDLAEIRYSSLPRSTMSEPLGSSSDHCISGYGMDCTVPLLETVSEEAKRQTGLDNPESSEYYYRDSFDHSSSESGLTSDSRSCLIRQYGTSENMKYQPNQKLHNMYQHPGQHNLVTNSSTSANKQNTTNNIKNLKKFSIIQAFIPSFILVVFVLIISAIFILESESDIFVPLKNLPEMINLKYQYYQPIKEYFIKQFG